MPKTLEVASPAPRKARSPKRPAAKRATSEQIQMRAYEIYLERDGAAGTAFDDWIQAERELLAKPAKASRGTNGRASRAKTL